VRQAGNAIDAYIAIRGADGFMDAIKKRGTRSNPKYNALIAAIKQPLTLREPTPDEIYSAGYDFVCSKDFNRNGHIRDSYSWRWLKCVDCGGIVREDETVTYGGNLGMNQCICRGCGIGVSHVRQAITV
jgi:hypothetical protein